MKEVVQFNVIVDVPDGDRLSRLVNSAMLEYLEKHQRGEGHRDRDWVASNGVRVRFTLPMEPKE